MPLNSFWIKAYIKGWSFEVDEGGMYTIFAIISIPAKNLKKIGGEENCKVFLESVGGIFYALSIDDRGCVKTDIENCRSTKRYIYIKLKVIKRTIVYYSLIAGFKEKVRILVGLCNGNRDASINESTNICQLCIYGIEKLYNHGL